LDFLTNYADYLSSDVTHLISTPDETSCVGMGTCAGDPKICSGQNCDPRPHPVFFPDVECRGGTWPPASTNISDNDENVFNPNNLSFSGMYIPGYWQVQFQLADGTYFTYPNELSAFPVLVGDVTTNPKLVSMKDKVIRIIKFIYQPKSDDNLKTWTVKKCQGLNSVFIGARTVTSYLTGGRACDTVMSGYCSGTIPGTNNLRLDTDLACVCLKEEAALAKKFCTKKYKPTPTGCRSDEDNLDVIIPVTCFGKQCSSVGYRWGRMLNQQCNITLCEQILSLFGDNLITQGESVIYCGNTPKVIPTPNVSPTVSVSAQTTPASSLPVGAWVIFGMIFFMLFIIIPYVYLVYRRYYRSRGKLQHLGKPTPKLW
jgi:hypothetical protein